MTVSAAGDPAAAWRAVEADTATATGSTRFRVLGPGGIDLRAAVRLPGAFNVANALLALATLGTVGAPAELAVRGVAGGACPGGWRG